MALVVSVCISAPDALAVTDLTPVDASKVSVVGTVNTPFGGTTSLTPVGPVGLVTFTAISPALPPGLTLETTTGSVTGTPTATSPPTTYTITATDDLPDGTSTQATATISIAIDPPSLNPAVLPAAVGVVGLPLSTGPPTPVGFLPCPALPPLGCFSITPAPPLGWSFDSVTGVLSATPAVAADPVTYDITYDVSPDTATTKVTVSVPAPAVTPTSPTMVAAVGAAITNFAFQGTGFAVAPKFAVTPALPVGLTLDPVTGILSGTAGTATPSKSYTVTATSGVAPDVQTASTTLSLSVSALALAPQAIAGLVGSTVTPTSGYTALDLATAGLVAPATFAADPPLPSGLTVSATTGVVSGKPTVTVVPAKDYTLTATDANGATAKGVVTIAIAPVQLLPPVIYFAQAGATAGSMRVLFLGPANAPSTQTYAAEVYDSSGTTLIKTVRPMTSLTEITGLTPGTTYSIVIVADGTDAYLVSRSAPKSGLASTNGGKLTPPTITTIVGGATPGSISVSFNPTPNAPTGLTYTAQVYDEDQLTLVKAIPRVTSPVLITGLTPGVTYYVIIAADPTATTLEAPSRGRTVTATGQKVVATSVASAASLSPSKATVVTTTTSTALGAGWLRPTAAQAAKARKVSVLVRPSTAAARAPSVRVQRNRTVTLRLKGLSAQTLYIADVQLAGAWRNLGSARAAWGGGLTLPAFTATRPGTYPLRLSAMGQPTTYLKVVVSKGAR